MLGHRIVFFVKRYADLKLAEMSAFSLLIVNFSVSFTDHTLYNRCMFSDPAKIIQQCGIQPGMIIADFGAGSGFYTLAVAQALSSTGKVYAIDAQKELLVRLETEARRINLSNVDVIWGDVEKSGGTKIKDSTVTLVLICNVLFQLEDKRSTLNEAKRILIPGGRVLVVDWQDSFGGIGPRKDQVVTKDAAVKLFESCGFASEREISAGSHHYGFMFKKM